jgi:hypothetical protein
MKVRKISKNGNPDTSDPCLKLEVSSKCTPLLLCVQVLCEVGLQKAIETPKIYWWEYACEDFFFKVEEMNREVF